MNVKLGRGNRKNFKVTSYVYCKFYLIKNKVLILKAVAN